MTQTIFIDAAQYATPRALHEALRRMLALPGHYGHNADALYDCLSERTSAVHAVIVSDGADDTAAALRKVIRVIKDLGGDVKHL